MASKALSDISDLSYADIDQFMDVGEVDTAETRHNVPTIPAIVPEDTPPHKLPQEQGPANLVVFPDYTPPHDTYYFNIDMIHLLVSLVASLHPSTLTAFLEVGGTRYRVHRFLFLRDSAYWRNQSAGLTSSKPISLEDVTAVEFDAFLSILYTS